MRACVVSLAIAMGTATAAPAPPAAAVQIDLDGDGAIEEVATSGLKLKVSGGGAIKTIFELPEQAAELEAGKAGEAVLLVRGARGRVMALVWRAGALAAVVDETPQGSVKPRLEVDGGRLVLWWETPAVRSCGGPLERLLVEQVDLGRRKRTRVVPPIIMKQVGEQYSATAAPPPGLLAGPPAGGFRFESATSPGATPDEFESPAAPVALGDGNPATVWAEDGPGPGQRESLYARAPAADFKLIALRLTRAGPTYNQPQTLELWTEHGGRLFFGLPRGEGALWLTLPKPEKTSCLTVRIASVYPGKGAPAGGGQLGIAELELYTELDLESGGGLDQLVGQVRKGGLDGQEALKRLRPLGPRAAAKLVQAFGAAGAADKLRLALAVAELGAPEAADLLVAVIGQSGEDQRARLEAALGKLDDQAVPALGRLLGDHAAATELRLMAARLLGASKAGAAVDALLAVAGDVEGDETAGRPPEVERALGEALARSRAPGVARRLQQSWANLQAGQSGAVLGMDILALAARGHLGSDEDGAAELAQQVIDAALAVRTARARGVRSKTRPDSRFYRLSIRLINALGSAWERGSNAAAAEELVKILHQDPEGVVRAAALEQAARQRTPEVVAAALAARGDRDPRVRALAATVLAGQRGAGERGALRTLLGKDPWPFVRENAAASLATGCVLDRLDLQALLVAGAADDGREVRVTTLRALTGCAARAKPAARPPQVGALLVQIAQNPDDEIAVRVEAAGLLGQLRDPTLVPAMLDILSDAAAAAPYSEGATLQAAAVASALARMCPAAARRDLTDLAGDPDPTLAAAGQRALDRCKW